MAPLDFHTLSLTYQISEILPFLVVNTSPIFIAPPLKIFLPTPLITLTNFDVAWCWIIHFSLWIFVIDHLIVNAAK